MELGNNGSADVRGVYLDHETMRYVHAVGIMKRRMYTHDGMGLDRHSNGEFYEGGYVLGVYPFNSVGQLPPVPVAQRFACRRSGVPVKHLRRSIIP